MATSNVEIETLNERHREIDRILEEEEHRPAPDSLKIAELKRQKLRLKDEITKLSSVTD